MPKYKYERREPFTSYSAAAIAQSQWTKEGWEIDENDPPTQIGFPFELVMFRNTEPPKSRAEILEAARAAKAAKKGNE